MDGSDGLDGVDGSLGVFAEEDVEGVADHFEALLEVAVGEVQRREEADDRVAGLAGEKAAGAELVEQFAGPRLLEHEAEQQARAAPLEELVVLLDEPSRPRRP